MAGEGVASLNATTDSQIGVLTELHPCFEGYAGIPQEARLLFSGLARTSNIRLGGLLDGSAASAPPSVKSGASAAQRLFAQTRQVIALDADPAQISGTRHSGLRRFLPRPLFDRIALLRKSGRSDNLDGAIDGTVFGDWLWTRLFEKGLSAGERADILRAKFLVPRASRRDAERLGALSPNARPALNLAKGGWKVFLTHTPSPYRVSGGTMIVRYHDAIPLLWPHTIGAALAHAHAHFRMLEGNVSDGAWFVCDSEPSRDDLLRFFPQAASRALVVPVLSAVRPAPLLRAPEGSGGTVGAIAEIAMRCRAIHRDASFHAEVEARDVPFILAVSTLEPRKNYGLLMRAFGLARRSGAKLKLVVVANAGWRSETELAELRALLEGGSALHLANVPVRDLETLYANAHAVVCASRAEGFDLASVEAMAQGTPVLASDIPVHRSVCGDAVEYFDPYDADDLARRLIDIAMLPRRAGRLADLSDRGRRQAEKYRPDAIMPRWSEVFTKVLAG